MKVLLLTENWPPRQGGIENYLTHIAALLPQESVTVVAPSDVMPTVKGKGIKAVQKERFFWPIIRPAWLPLFVQLFRQFKKEPANIIICGKALFEGLVGYYLKRYLRIPYIVCTYAMEIDEWMKRPRDKRKLVRVLMSADRVVYINDATKKQLQELGVATHRLVKIWPGVDERFFVQTSPHLDTLAARSLRANSAAQSGSLSSLSLSQLSQDEVRSITLKDPYILCVSRLVPRKGVDLLVEAFAGLGDRQINLVIAGDGPQRAGLEKLVQKLGIRHKVKFLGFVPDEELPQLYQGADFFALTPREAEGFGIVYIEAAASGIAAVATHSAGSGEAVIHTQTGLVVQPTVVAVQEALMYMLDHPAERQQMAERARARAWDQFRWSKRILLVKGMIDAVMMEQLQKK